MDGALEIDVKELLHALVKRAWIIILCAILVAGFMLAYTVSFVTPMYKAGASIYVSNQTEDLGKVQSNDLAVALQLVNTYVNIIKSDSVLQRVVDEMQLQLSVEQIRGMVAASVVDETEIFRVEVISPAPQLSADIVNAIADIAPGEIASIIDGSTAKVIDYAKVPTRRHSPSYTTNTFLGAVIGAVLAIGFFTVRMLMDNRIKTEADLEKICALPVLGAIPDFAVTSKNKGYGYGYYGYGYYGHGYYGYGKEKVVDDEDAEKAEAALEEGGEING